MLIGFSVVRCDKLLHARPNLISPQRSFEQSHKDRLYDVIANIIREVSWKKVRYSVIVVPFGPKYLRLKKFWVVPTLLRSTATSSGDRSDELVEIGVHFAV